MADSYIGVRECGCITAWLSNDDHLTKAELRSFYRKMADTGRMVQMADLADIKGSDRFMPYDCPHKDGG